MLRELYEHLLDRARATSEDQACQLRGGARIVVRVRAGIVTLSLGRKEKPLGDREEITFMVACRVPVGATRIPAVGQIEREKDGAIWHVVGFRWAEAEAAQQGAPSSPGAET